MDQPDVIMNEPPKKGGGWLKWTLIGCGGLLVLGAIIVGIAAYYLSQNATMSNDPAAVETIAQEILQFEKPEEFKGVMAGSILGWKMAVLAAPGSQDLERGGIMLMSIPVAMNTKQAEQQLKEAIKGQGGPGQDEVTEQLPAETFKVRGEDVTAQVGVTGGGDGKPRTLQYSMTFKGASEGLVLLMIGGPEEMDTHDWVQNFLDTVR
jgi:hypothetical protein